jgi:phage shock protein A
MPKRAQRSVSACRLSLLPQASAATALEETFAARDALLAWLDGAVPPQQSADLVALNQRYYEPARARFGLPSQMTVLALRDWMRRRRGEAADGLALDEKLFSVRNVSQASVATLRGRLHIPFRIAGYLPGWHDNATARLLRSAHGFEIHVATTAAIPQEERSMATENIVSRIGRLIAGMAHGAVDSAERANAKPILEQAIREIDAAAEEVRGDIGRKTAERFRVEARRRELASELSDLDGKISLAVEQDRDDLAAAGIERQLDIESQLGVLDALLKDVDDSLAQFNTTLDAVRASRREAEARLAELARSLAESPAMADSASGGYGRAAARVERAEAAVARVTGVPGGLPPAAPAVDELRQLARQHAMAQRLARIKTGQ